MSELDAKYFRDEDQAREFLEGLRWADGVVCPHCGVIGEHYRLEGEATRKGLWKCKDCRQQFTVTVGTVFERSKIALNKWLLATYLMCASKKGISSLQLSRMLGVTYKTAWFMTHRLREAMKSGEFIKQLGGKDAIVEVDETYWGNTRSRKIKKEVGYMHKERIVSLVERGGNVRSFHVQHVSGETLKPLLKSQVHKDTQIMTDDFGGYHKLNEHFADHQTVRHTAKEYVRGNAHTNTIEGFFSILKRGLIGTFHHVGAQHLKRYIAEFDFRYNSRKMTDFERTLMALRGIAGKRLMYTTPLCGRA